ncbi:hypothetical protein KHA80_02115 [Anaerobacillus sp. HL2]|nr:hypothetical protein KHA80_02115 [Anaerobacillus sp. HL2]
MEEALKKRIAIHRSITLKPNHKCGCNKGVSCPEHAIDSHNHTFQALKINVSHPIDRIELEKWLNRLPKACN